MGVCETKVLRKGPMSTTSFRPTLYIPGYSNEIAIPRLNVIKHLDEICVPRAIQYKILELLFFLFSKKCSDGDELYTV